MENPDPDYDWTSHDLYPKEDVTCIMGHDYETHSRFSGKLVAIISRIPCPVCGQYELKTARGKPEFMSLERK